VSQHCSRRPARRRSRPLHVRRSDELSLLDDSVVDFSRLHGHRQITDAYLLALAVRRGGVLASFDAGVPLSAVRGATKRHLLTL